MSHGPPVGPLVGVGVVTRVQATAVPVPPAPGLPPEPVAPPEPVVPPEETAASELAPVIWQPQEKTPTNATRVSPFHRFLTLIWIGVFVRSDESCYGKFLGRSMRPS
jgi:hypothetical protein